MVQITYFERKIHKNILCFHEHIKLNIKAVDFHSSNVNPIVICVSVVYFLHGERENLLSYCAKFPWTSKIWITHIFKAYKSSLSFFSDDIIALTRNNKQELSIKIVSKLKIKAYKFTSIRQNEVAYDLVTNKLASTHYTILFLINLHINTSSV